MTCPKSCQAEKAALVEALRAAIADANAQAQWEPDWVEPARALADISPAVEEMLAKVRGYEEAVQRAERAEAERHRLWRIADDLAFRLNSYSLNAHYEERHRRCHLLCKNPVCLEDRKAIHALLEVGRGDYW